MSPTRTGRLGQVPGDPAALASLTATGAKLRTLFGLLETGRTEHP